MAHRSAASGRLPVCGGQISPALGRLAPRQPRGHSAPSAPNPVAPAASVQHTLPPQSHPHRQSSQLQPSAAPAVHCPFNSSDHGNLRSSSAGSTANAKTRSCTSGTGSSISSSGRDQRSLSLVRDGSLGGPAAAPAPPSQTPSPPSPPRPPTPPSASSPSSSAAHHPSPDASESATSPVGRRTVLTTASWVALSWVTDWVAGGSSGGSSASGSGGGSGGGGGALGFATWGRAAHAATSAATTTAPGSGAAVELSTLQEEAYLAYAERRFQDAVNLLTQCIAAEPGAVRWREMRAQALVDGKNFPAAIRDFEDALDMVPDPDTVTRARLLTGRALAYEGLGQWEAALADYRRGMDLAAEAGESLDPYILNSIGNCLNSLGRWEEAREQYLASSEVFQRARGFRGRNGSTTPRLDGAIFAASNAALMRAQLGDTEGAVQEMVRIARRAPGSADMRAALAALYWSQGRRQEAEEMWEFACDRITVGCAKYTDLDWLGRIRRWPPAMVALMADFLALK